MDSYRFQIDENSVRRFVEASWAGDDAGAFRFTAGLPPTYLAVIPELADKQHMIEALGWDVGRCMHGAEHITMHEVIPVGTQLEVVQSIERLPDAVGKRGGVMRRAMRHLVLHMDGRRAADVDRVLLELESVPAVRGNSQAPAAHDEGLRPRRGVGCDADPATGMSFGPLTLTDLVRYAAASNDLTAVHYDREAAASAGFDRPFAMGMLSAALTVRALSGWWTRGDLPAPSEPWRMECRFTDIVWPGETLTVHAEKTAQGAVAVCRAGDRLVTRVEISRALNRAPAA